MATDQMLGIDGGNDYLSQYAAKLASYQSISDKVNAYMTAAGIGTTTKPPAKQTSTGLAGFVPWYVWAGVAVAVVGGLLYLSESAK